MIKEKTESTLARLGRLTVDIGSAGDKGEYKRKVTLFECVFVVPHEPVTVLIPRQGS